MATIVIQSEHKSICSRSWWSHSCWLRDAHQVTWVLKMYILARGHGLYQNKGSPKEELSVDFIPGKLMIKGFIKHKDMLWFFSLVFCDTQWVSLENCGKRWEDFGKQNVSWSGAPAFHLLKHSWMIQPLIQQKFHLDIYSNSVFFSF